ncbi:hypothetical protein [Nostoc sp. GT001]|uniref:hypothetical protein n=1 Tax=Nostoc sp. GT001 TaxID=3056647 RepID=UPI0025AA7807|nr:hypothetical protein [Nostoc sp. GT001]MDM9580119.1 hypothetical protein [Nostoc sp. GT001]
MSDTQMCDYRIEFKNEKFIIFPLLSLTLALRTFLVVRQPKIAGWRSAEEQRSRGAGEQGSRGEAYTSSFPSASLLTTFALFPWQTTSPKNAPSTHCLKEAKASAT